MSTVLLIIQLIISIILTGLILIQRSEGGALGIGGGGGGGLMSGRSATSSIVRMTGILGTLFLINCLVLAVVFKIENKQVLIVDDETIASSPASDPAAANESTSDAAETTAEDLTSTVDSSEGTIPSAEENSEETPAKEAGPEKDE